MTRHYRKPSRPALSLPYGIFYLEDGRELLFSREYRALFLRLPGRKGVHVCNGQKHGIPKIGTEYFHQGGVVTPELCRKLLEIEQRFCRGDDIGNLFWKPEETSRMRRQGERESQAASNVIKMFPEGE
jgi:hypothetical protein